MYQLTLLSVSRDRVLHVADPGALGAVAGPTLLEVGLAVAIATTTEEVTEDLDPQ